MSVWRRTSRTARTHTIFAYGQATCADAIASAVGAVKGGDSWMRALGLELTGRPEAIIQGKGSAGVKERGHTQQALTSSGTCNIVVPCASLNLLVKPYAKIESANNFRRKPSSKTKPMVFSGNCLHFLSSRKWQDMGSKLTIS